MKLYRYEQDGRIHIGAEVDGGLAQLPFDDIREIVEGGEEALSEARQALKKGPTTSAEDVRILAPLRPGKLLCSGLNYRSHVEENPDATFLEDPRFFVKTPNTFIGPNDPIRHPGAEFQVDYEVELAVVIGRPMYRIPQREVMGRIFGYSILHDVGARFIQFKDRNEDMGKNFDTFAPLGPCIVTADEIPHPERLKLKLELNGQTMQDGTNEEWCFSLPRLLAWLAMAMTLEPGDVVSTGTPSGIGFFRNPPVFLKPGDRCRLTIDGIGTLENPVVAIDRSLHSELAIERS